VGRQQNRQRGALRGWRVPRPRTPSSS
jgi:hypothetical protein